MNLLTSAVAAVVTGPGDRVLLCQQSQGHRLWGLPGGKVRNGESPIHAITRDIREETGTEIEIVDLVGIYQLTGGGHGLPDLLVHIFRGRITAGDVAVNSPGRISRLAWHFGPGLPEPLTATARAALADAGAGRSGVLRTVHRDVETEARDAEEAPALVAAVIASTTANPASATPTTTATPTSGTPTATATPASGTPTVRRLLTSGILGPGRRRPTRR